MKCKLCGAPMKVGRNILICEYCGNEEKITNDEEDLKSKSVFLNIVLQQAEQSSRLLNELYGRGIRDVRPI